MLKPVLIVSSNARHREKLVRSVRDSGLEARLCASANEARRLLPTEDYTAVLCDDRLPDGDFTSVISQAQRLPGATPVIVVSRRDDWESYMIALAAGATDYLAFPPYKGEVDRSLARAAELSRSLATVV